MTPKQQEALDAVRKARGNKAEAARRLGIDPKSLRDRLAGAQSKADPVAARTEARTQAHDRRTQAALADEVAALREAVDVQAALSALPPAPVRRWERTSGLRDGAFVALASDWHVEERVRATDTPTGNAYDLDEAARRIDRFFAGVAWLVAFNREAFAIRSGVLWLGGDLVSGHIHEELLESNACSPVETLLWLQPRLEAGIRGLVDALDLDRLVVPCSYGNHGRTTARRRVSTGAANSYEWLLYQSLARTLADDPRIEVHAPPSHDVYVQVYDFDLHFQHGDDVRYAGGVGGITIPLNKRVAQWDKVRRSNYHHIGHYHQYLDHGPVTCNGSLIGYNAFAWSIGASPEVAQQAFYVLDSSRGKSVRAPVWVTE